jgi:hypothetical protein
MDRDRFVRYLYGAVDRWLPCKPTAVRPGRASVVGQVVVDARVGLPVEDGLGSKAGSKNSLIVPCAVCR